MTTATATRPTTPFERVGGHDTLREIVDHFYDLMDGDSAYARLRALHAVDLAPMRASLAGFLAGWSGGPRDWFEANPGRCMMSAHRDVSIDAVTAEQWAAAMREAVVDMIGATDPEMAGALSDVLERMALGMAR
jgi:hemoglobin